MFAETEIKKMMKNLGLSREEAIQLLKDDANDVSVDLTPEQQRVVKKMSQGDRKKENAPRKRERKPDDAKRGLMMLLANAINSDPNASEWTLTNVEREATFRYNGELYRLTLAKPREKKEE